MGVCGNACCVAAVVEDSVKYVCLRDAIDVVFSVCIVRHVLEV